MQVRMWTPDDFVFGHPLIGNRSEDSERLERLGIEEHVVDHPAEIVRVVGKRHDLVRYGRRQLKKILSVFISANCEVKDYHLQY